MKIPNIEIKKRLLVYLDNIVGPKNYSFNSIDRLSYSRDSNFRSAIQAHYSKFENFPGLIVWPVTTDQVSQVIKAANKFQMFMTPFGGGSGVCGGGISYENGMMIDVKKMQKIIRLDKERLFVDVQAGISGLQLEKELARKGFTLGHFPSSIVCATLGGYLAARSAGQLSSKYGKIEDMIIDLEFVDGNGLVHQTSDVTRHRGFDFTQAIIGSEGTLGIITRARLKIYPLPQKRLYQAFTFSEVSYGLEAMRRIMQTGIKPDVLRLYDELDSAIMIFKKEKQQQQQEHSLAVQTPKVFKDVVSFLKSKSLLLALYGHSLVNEAVKFSWFGCALVIMLEGHPKIIEQQMKLIRKICEDLGAKDQGEGPARHWHKHRYSVSYKASKLFLDKAFTDTMEVATTWSHINALYDGVRKALKHECLVLAHISHVYAEGAAIYFTFVSPLTGLRSSLKTYDRIWKKALTAVQKYNGVISHHHGIGKLKTPHLKKEWGDAQQLYLQLKKFFDPHQTLNQSILKIEDSKS